MPLYILYLLEGKTKYRNLELALGFSTIKGTGKSIRDKGFNLDLKSKKDKKVMQRFCIKLHNL